MTGPATAYTGTGYRVSNFGKYASAYLVEVLLTGISPGEWKVSSGHHRPVCIVCKQEQRQVSGCMAWQRVAACGSMPACACAGGSACYYHSGSGRGDLPCGGGRESIEQGRGASWQTVICACLISLSRCAFIRYCVNEKSITW